MENAVDGLEKASLANSDVELTDAQTPSLKQRGKLSSFGKIFKPWKWRKKKTSDKFQDLSKVLERKISTRQTREELIRKGVLIPDQNSEEPINSNGHTAPISVEPVVEEVKVDIEVQDDSPGDTDDKTAKFSLPKKSQGASKNASELSVQSASSSAAQSTETKAKGGGSDQVKTKKQGRETDPARSSVARRATPESESWPADALEPAVREEVQGKSKPPGSEEKPEHNRLAKTVEDHMASLEETGEELSHGQSITEDTSFTESPSEVYSVCPEEPQAKDGGGDGGRCQSGSLDSATESPQQVKSEASGMGDEQRTQVTIPDNPNVTVIPDSKRKCHTSDSDSDGPILYRDDEDEDEEDEYTSSTKLPSDERFIIS